VIGAAIEETAVGSGINPPSRTILPVGSEYEDRVGFVNTWPDEDEVVRRARFALTSTELKNRPAAEGEKVFFSLAARAASKAGYGAKVPPDHLFHLIRYAYQSETLLRSQKPPSLYQIFVPTFWEKNYGNGEFFRDKIVLVGPEGRSNKDTLRSPFGDIAGAAFHLNAINAIINGEFLRQTPLGIDLLLIVAGGLLAAALGWFIPNPWWRLLALAAGVIVWFGAGVALYNAGWVVPILSPILVISGSVILFSAAEQIVDRLERARLRKTFERYVSKDVVKELLDNPQGWLNTLGGQRKTITILFSDVRGFTTLTESSDAHALVAQLNEYFDGMVEIVFRHKGTLDKFIGDAVMAHWGSITTEGSKADARNAVATALQMRRALALLNPEWKKREMLELKFGIGINHGEAIVGNLGSKEKAEVSAISDAVNLASRLEGVTKQYGIDLCIGEAVAPLVRDAFVLRSLDLILVKGKTKPVEIFTVLDERRPGIAELPWLASHEEALRRYRAGDFVEAERLWREVLAQNPGDSIAEVFLERCAALQKKPPNGEWHGVFEMTSK
jgi:adenylate cyclase